MAPELWLSDDAQHTVNSDIWAVGCLIIEVYLLFAYEMEVLTGAQLDSQRGGPLQQFPQRQAGDHCPLPGGASSETVKDGRSALVSRHCLLCARTEGTMVCPASARSAGDAIQDCAVGTCRA